MSPLLPREILVVLVNTAGCKYPVQECENVKLPNQMQLSEKRKLFLNLFLHFWNLHHILSIL